MQLQLSNVFGLPVEALVFVFTIILLMKYWLHKRWGQLEQYNIPHDPPSVLSLGHLRNLFSEEIFEYELKQKAKHGLIWGYYSFHLPRIVIHDPEILRRIYIQEFSNFPSRVGDRIPLGFSGKYIRNGILATYGDQWKRGRVTLIPTFSTSKLKLMMTLVVSCVENTLKAFRRKVEKDNGRISTRQAFAKLSLDVTCSTSFSVDVNSQDDEVAEPMISKCARELTNSKFVNFANILSIASPIFRKLFTKINENKSNVIFLNEICKRMVERREQDSVNLNQRVDLMQLMIDAKISDSAVKPGLHKGLTSSEIIGNALTMLLAGYETTATAMTYFAYNLAMHPVAQKKLLAEIDEMYVENGGKLDFDTVNNLKYLQMCLNESLRLYNPIGRTIRTSESEITVCGLTIPKKWIVVLPINALCHDPEYWDKPMEFQPERMEDMSSIDPMMFQPFGAGPRNCIGAKFALMVIKTTFCKILKEFSFEPDIDTPSPPLKLSFGVTTRPVVNFSLRVVPRYSCGK